MLITITQWISASLSWILLKLFADFRIKGAENLRELNKPFVLVANHESYLDPQLLGVAMLYKPSLFPLRYMAKNELFNYPLFNLLLWVFGAFKAHRKTGIGKSLLTPTKILERGGGVIMFLEGICPEFH
jgi:1-acyl-sn-glycerol-3-phosphate acyltransferase